MRLLLLVCRLRKLLLLSFVYLFVASHTPKHRGFKPLYFFFVECATATRLFVACILRFIRHKLCFKIFDMFLYTHLMYSQFSIVKSISGLRCLGALGAFFSFLTSLGEIFVSFGLLYLVRTKSQNLSLFVIFLAPF